VELAQDYPWSSARGHCGLAADSLLSPLAPPECLVNLPPAEIQPRWAQWLADEDEQATATIRCNTLTGRPCGSAGFIEALEAVLGRVLRPKKRGPKPKAPHPARRNPTADG
jgi:putative transposase